MLKEEVRGTSYVDIFLDSESRSKRLGVRINILWSTPILVDSAFYIFYDVFM